MINLEEFLLKNMCVEEVGSFALVNYNEMVEAVWVGNFYNLINEEVFFLEFPCELCKVCEVGDDIDKFYEEYMKEINLAEGNFEGDYFEEFVKPMIHNGWLYEINNFQTDPYLPKEVDDIKLISERECLMWLLENQKEH